MAVKTKKRAVSKKVAPVPKSKAIARRAAGNGLEKAIIAMNKSLGESIERLGEKMDKSLLAMTASIAASKVETDAKMAASKTETDAKIAEANASIAASDAKMAASKVETDAKIAAANASMAASFAELDRVVNETKSQLAGLSDSDGRAVESLAYSFFNSRMTFAGVRFDDMEVGVNRKRRLPDGTKIKGEYDVVLYNGTSIALIEAKNRVRTDDITKLIDEQLPRFKLFFPQYKDYTYYLGLCGMSFEDGVEAEALSRGIGTLKPNGESLESNETTVKAW
ncbi:MAG: hypothetical protein LBB74_07885 [Chitinispirillales bacterium]|jgi:hypothetical protein|nr:hypothetical protein [Chitinispirillales bacterium]